MALVACIQEEALDNVVDRLVDAGLCNSRGQSTLGAFIDDYINNREDAAENTTRNFKNRRQNIVDYFGADKPLHDISTGDADDWRQWLANKKYSDSTISKAVKHAKQFLLMAKRKGLVRSSPFHHLKAGGEQNEARKRFIERSTIVPSSKLPIRNGS